MMLVSFVPCISFSVCLSLFVSLFYSFCVGMISRFISRDKRSGCEYNNRLNLSLSLFCLFAFFLVACSFFLNNNCKTPTTTNRGTGTGHATVQQGVGAIVRGNNEQYRKPRVQRNYQAVIG